MIIKKAFKFRLEPRGEQWHKLASFAGCCRFVYNRGLSRRISIFEEEGRSVSLYEQNNELAHLKKEAATSWLGSVHSQILQQSLGNLDRAFQNFFRGIKKKETQGFPKYKSKGEHDSFRYPQGIKVRDNRVFLPKIGWVSFIKSRDIEGTIKQGTVSKDGKHWYVSIQTEIDTPSVTHPSASMVGIDVGVTNFAVLSNNTTIAPLNSFKKLEEELAIAQRGLKRKEKFSQNWKKQKRKAQKVHRKIRNVRHDFLHKASTVISKNHAVVVMEDLAVKKMTKAKKGTLQNPGKNVAVKSRLNKAILDQGWYMFRTMLKYKLEWQGGKLLLVPPENTSRRCFCCGYIAAENRQTQSNFHCTSCGYSDNADMNAAKNILRAGLAQLACGEFPLGNSVKQEPLAAAVV